MRTRRYRREIGGPAGAALVLHLRREQRKPATCARVDAAALLGIELAAAGGLGAFLTQDAELLGEALAPVLRRELEWRCRRWNVRARGQELLPFAAHLADGSFRAGLRRRLGDGARCTEHGERGCEQEKVASLQRGLRVQGGILPYQVAGHRRADQSASRLECYTRPRKPGSPEDRTPAIPTHGSVDACTRRRALARASAPRQPGGDRLSMRARLVAGTVAAVLPDIDGLLTYVSPVAYLDHHRGLTHSVLLLPLWAFFVAWLFSRIARDARGWRPWYGVCALGLASHTALDVITSYGTMLAAPVSWHRFSLRTTFIIDLWLSSMLLAGLLASLASGDRGFPRRWRGRGGLRGPAACIARTCASLRCVACRRQPAGRSNGGGTAAARVTVQLVGLRAQRRTHSLHARQPDPPSGEARAVQDAGFIEARRSVSAAGRCDLADPHALRRSWQRTRARAIGMAGRRAGLLPPLRRACGLRRHDAGQPLCMVLDLRFGAGPRRRAFPLRRLPRRGGCALARPPGRRARSGRQAPLMRTPKQACRHGSWGPGRVAASPTKGAIDCMRDREFGALRATMKWLRLMPLHQPDAKRPGGRGSTHDARFSCRSRRSPQGPSRGRSPDLPLDAKGATLSCRHPRTFRTPFAATPAQTRPSSSCTSTTAPARRHCRCRVEDDEAVRLRHRAKDARALVARDRTFHAPSRGARENAALELGAAGRILRTAAAGAP